MWWINKIMLSGLCQTLYSCGASLEWPALTDLYQEEQRCAMYVAMSMDYFDSIAPYGCMVSLLFMQNAWGVFWRQRDFPTSVDGYAMAEWLRRRGNEFMGRFVTTTEMSTSGLAFATKRLMGGPILPPEWYPSSDAKVSQDLRETNAAMVDTRPDPCLSVDADTGSAFNEGIRNAMLHQQAFNSGREESLFSQQQSVMFDEKESLFAQSCRNMILDAEHLT
jgi:hypothetical protein